MRSQEDPECSQLKELCEKGKLTWDTMRGTLKKYYPVRDELNVVNGILMRDQRMIIPTSLRKLSFIRSIKVYLHAKKERISRFGGLE